MMLRANVVDDVNRAVRVAGLARYVARREVAPVSVWEAIEVVKREWIRRELALQEGTLRLSSRVDEEENDSRVPAIKPAREEGQHGEDKCRVRVKEHDETRWRRERRSRSREVRLQVGESCSRRKGRELLWLGSG